MRPFVSFFLSCSCVLFLIAGITGCHDDTPGHSDRSDSTAATDSTTGAETTPQTPSPSATTAWEVRQDFEKYFADAGVTGAFLLYDPQKNTILAYDTARCRTRFSPASTFKIFNSLVFLETGVIRDENEVIPWDSVKRRIDEWNRDHTLRSGIEHSVVWLYQELARRVGKETLQRYLDTVGYGNKTIGGKVDEFWLDGSLRISPIEQIDFLTRLHRYDLPFSRRTIDIVKDILIKEKTDQFTYRGKTGWALRNDMSIGWFVGYVERKEGVYFFAINIDMKDDDKSVKARTDITWKILSDLGLVGR